jgi:hypothetical protein
MSVSLGRPTAPVRARPLSEPRPALVLTLAGILFAGVLTLRLLAGDAADAYSMLYAFPVALVATAFGMRAGAGAGLLAVALIGLWAVTDDVSLTPVGWASRALPMLLLGVLVGEATDRSHRIELERRSFEAAALLHREAIEINDSLVQGMAAARWSLEAGNTDAALRMLDDTIARAHDLVSDLIRRAGMGGRAEHLPDPERS